MSRNQLAKGLSLLITVCLFFCFSCNTSTDKLIVKKKSAEGRMTGYLQSLEYEYRMLKDPATGKIPSGIRELELQQAREIATAAKLSDITANSYLFQGPNNMGGRTRAITFDVRYDGVSNQTLFAGGVSNGIYKSTDNGATWVRKTPAGFHFGCTSIAQDTRAGFENTWYYATGEAIGGSAGAAGALYMGYGIYKSTDNGETWARLPNSNPGSLENFDARQDLITKIIVDPTNGDVYFSAIDGIYRSTNGGTNWAAVLGAAGGANTGMVTDLVVTSTGRLYASFSGGSNLPGVWTSTDGSSWTQIAGDGAATNHANWQANGTYGRVVLAIAPSDEDIVYALYWNGSSNSNCTAPVPEADLFVWDQGTTTWTDLSANVPNETGCSVGNDPFAVQGGYDLVVAVKPDNANVVFIGGTNIYRSTDGFTSSGNTTRIGGYANASGYAMYTNSHPDIHSIVFQPTDASVMLCGNDGGIQRTSNDLSATVSWTQTNVGFRSFQYYYVTLDPENGNNKVLGGAQDNGTTRNISGTGVDHEMVLSGDGASVGLSNEVAGSTYEYVSSQLGSIYRRNSTLPAFFGTNIRPSGSSNSLFVTLFHLDQDNTENIYYASGDELYRNTSASTATTANWNELTGIETAITSGGAIDITALATSRGSYNAATSSLFVGSDNGTLLRLDNPQNTAAGTAPVDITGGSFPFAYISSISANPRNDDTLLVTFSNYNTQNIWWTGNANSATPTWHLVEGNLNLPSVRSSAIAVTSEGVEYFVGTSVGLFKTTIDGTSPATTTWTQEGPGEIDNAVVTSLAYRPVDGRLLVGTHGYGMWQSTLSLSVLPVTLGEFNGLLKNDHVMLNWHTINEENCKGFEIQKSHDGSNFRKIGFVNADGNNNFGKTYQFEDREPASDKNYYRLRIVDFDSKFSYSEVVLVSKTGRQSLYVVNPFRNTIDIRFAMSPKNVKILITDISGRIISRSEFKDLDQPFLSIRNLPSMGKGAYIMQVEADGERFTNRLIKQ